MPTPCPRCDGTGTQHSRQTHRDGCASWTWEEAEDCEQCNGSGEVATAHPQEDR